MNIESMVADYGIVAASILVCFVSGIFPIVNAEIYTVFLAGFIHDPTQLAAGAFYCALGQMLAKISIYYFSLGTLEFTVRKKSLKDKIKEYSEKMKTWGWKSHLFLFVSASVGMPPFMVLSVCAGIAKINPVLFFVTGLAGRFIRFYVIMQFPHLIKQAVQ